MNLIIKRGSSVFALHLGRADLRAVVLAAALASQPSAGLSQDLVAGSGGMLHAVLHSASWTPPPGLNNSVYAAGVCTLPNIITPQTRSIDVTSGQVESGSVR